MAYLLHLFLYRTLLGLVPISVFCVDLALHLRID